MFIPDTWKYCMHHFYLWNTGLETQVEKLPNSPPPTAEIILRFFVKLLICESITLNDHELIPRLTVIMRSGLKNERGNLFISTRIWTAKILAIYSWHGWESNGHCIWKWSIHGMAWNQTVTVLENDPFTAWLISNGYCTWKCFNCQAAVTNVIIGKIRNPFQTVKLWSIDYLLFHLDLNLTLLHGDFMSSEWIIYNLIQIQIEYMIVIE